LNSPGYTLVFKWCPNCNSNLIDSRDFECYACQDRRYYCSLDDEEE
jgi:ribosomal protein L33